MERGGREPVFVSAERIMKVGVAVRLSVQLLRRSEQKCGGPHRVGWRGEDMAIEGSRRFSVQLLGASQLGSSCSAAFALSPICTASRLQLHTEVGVPGMPGAQLDHTRADHHYPESHLAHEWVVLKALDC